MRKSAFELLSDTIRNTIKELGYNTPTSIQEKAIRMILEKPSTHLLITAPTGYGKTEAVIFPIIEILLRKKKEERIPIKVLYVTPLRALNRDIFHRMFPLLSKKLGIKIEVRHGDTSSSVRARQSRKPPEIMITTPETLQSILVGNRIREWLRNVEWVIIDEVHALVDGKRGSQLALGLQRLKRLANNFTIIGLSATIANKKEVLDYITAGEGGEIISIGEKKQYNVTVDAVEPKVLYLYSTGLPMLTINTFEIAKKIVKYVNETSGKVLVFTNTRDLAEILGLLVGKIAKFPVAVHHSSLSREVRLNVERGFKVGNLKCVIATSSLELGIDIGEADLVIQVMSPRRVETAIQRIGRSGHTFSGVSRGIIITGTFDDLFESLAISNLIEEGVIESIDVTEMNYDVLAHQIVGIVRENYLEGKKLTDPVEVYKLVKKAYPYRELKYEKFMELLEFMDKHCNLIRLKEGKIGLSRKSIRFYFNNVSTIPSLIKYKVVDISEKSRKVGELDSKYVLELNKGDVFLLAGMPREVIEIDSRRREVVVVSVNVEGKPPTWIGELLPVSFEVAKKVGNIRAIFHDPKLIDEYKEYLTEDGIKALKSSLNLYGKDRPPSNSDNIVIEFDLENGIIVFHALYGNKINKTLATLLSALFLDNANMPYISFDSDAYRVIIRIYKGHMFSSDHLFDIIEKTLNIAIDIAFNKERFEKLLAETVIEFNINELAWYFINVMKRFGLIWDDTDLSKKQILRLISKFRGKIVLEEAVREYTQSKMDIKGAIRILKMIDEGKVNIWFNEGISPLATQSRIASNIVIKDVNYIVERKYEERLLNREVKYICLSCGFEKVDKVYNYMKRCPNCNSERISAVKRWDENEIVKKRIKGESLTREENEKWKQINALSRFLKFYGHTALLPLAATGVGIKQALEILRKHADSKSSLITEIRKREINYFKSKSIIEQKYI